MKIYLDIDTEILLRSFQVSTSLEFSGLADVFRKDGELFVTNPFVLDVGSFGFTDFTPEMIRKLLPSTHRRCWFHRHPISCWSGTDLNTMTTTPCGSIPQMIQWAVAIVWTPKGWLGRLDTFVPTHRHFDLEVVTLVPEDRIYDEAVTYARKHSIPNQVEKLHKAFQKRHSYDEYPDENFDTMPAFSGDKVLKHHPKPQLKGKFVQKLFPWLLDKPKERKEG